MNRKPLLAILLVLLSLIATACPAQFRHMEPMIPGEIRVTIHVVDESGTPVPYATLWSRYAWHSGALSPLERVNEGQPMDQATLVRIARRHQPEFEAFHRFEFPLYWLQGGVLHPPLTNAEGLTVDHVLLDDLKLQRGNVTGLGYVAMKRGFAIADASIDTQDGSAAYTITLRLTRLKGTPMPAPAYQEAFDQARYELSFTDRNESGQARLDSIRQRMQQALAQAEGAGDRAEASRIAYRMSFLPQLIYDKDGHQIGFSQSVQKDPANIALRARAAELDPGATLSKVFRFDRELEAMFAQYKIGRWPQTPEERALSVPHVERMERIVRSMGDDADPWQRVEVAKNFERLQQFQRAYEELEAIRDWEPTAVHFDKEVIGLRYHAKEYGGVEFTPGK